MLKAMPDVEAPSAAALRSALLAAAPDSLAADELAAAATLVAQWRMSVQGHNAACDAWLAAAQAPAVARARECDAGHAVALLGALDSAGLAVNSVFATMLVDNAPFQPWDT
jgi:hypothetical protein